MYKIVQDTGEVLGYTDNPRWIKKHSNGCFVQCPQKEAKGIAFKSIPYSLGSNDALEGAEGTVYMFYEEDDDTLFKNTKDITDAQNAICEQSEDVEEMVSALENAICELSELIG